jgi:hypothetical protein
LKSTSKPYNRNRWNLKKRKAAGNSSNVSFI